MSRTRRTAGCSLLVVVGLIAAGCGSGSADESEDSQAATATIQDQANARTTTPAEPTAPPPTGQGSTAAEGDLLVETEARPECRRLTDFDDGDNEQWFIVNDGVMGGRSFGSIEFDESRLRFTGTVITDGGGFTSIRLPLEGDLVASTRIELRIQSDNRGYGVTFEDNTRVGRRSVTHEASLGPGDVDPDGWAVVSVSYEDLRPTIFGQAIEAAAFDPDQAREIGIIIADGRDGDFALDLDWIDVCS